MKTNASQPGPGKKILIVEDEADMCLLLNIILNGGSVQLDHVKSLEGANEYMKSNQPDVVLLDNQLPDGMGIDYITEIKKIHPSARIIMITGFDASAGDVALENGADVFLTKPFTRQQLQNAVNKLI